MPLPVLEAPKYSLVVPSTKKELKYRPFLVKEEKILMIAQESTDASQIEESIKDIIRACTFEKIDVDSLTTYDLEYILLKLREKSVGESSKFFLTCKECGAKNEVIVNLRDVGVDFPEKVPDNNIELSKGVGITLSPVSIKRLGNIDKSDINSVIATVIETIYDEENVYSVDNVSKEELDAFIDSFTHKNLEEIQNFVKNQPTLKHTVNFKCSECGHENTYTLEGIQSFF
jgi:DNA-directed RNA polymerase subunit M/transcription elongation factor TFIIS